MKNMTTEGARLERTFDWMVVFIAICLFMGAFHLHAMLTVGDWDFWTDWKDRRWWVTHHPDRLDHLPRSRADLFVGEASSPLWGDLLCACVSPRPVGKPNFEFLRLDILSD